MLQKYFSNDWAVNSIFRLHSYYCCVWEKQDIPTIGLLLANYFNCLSFKLLLANDLLFDI